MARLTLILSVLAALFALLGWGRIILEAIREMRWRKQQTGKWLLLLALCLLPSWAEANEARCTELGANCICGTSMDTTSISDSGDGQHFKLNDGASKVCSSEVSGYAIDAGSGQTFNGVTSGADITALPAAHTNTAVLRADTTTNAFLGVSGVNIPGSVPTARRSIRIYKYWSSTYNAQSNSGDSCNANKIAQFGKSTFSGPMFTTEGGAWTIYDINTAYSTNVSVDCCVGPGPGNAQDGPSLTGGLRGKWWRIEIITHNAASGGPGTTWQMYIKNVTDDADELLVLDTSQAATGQGWLSPTHTADLHVTGDLDTMLINMFRSTNGATPCAGFASYSHYLYAAWDTDAGQRIGAATEIEGSGGGGGVAVAQSNPMVGGGLVFFYEIAPVTLGAIWHFRQAILSGFLAVWMMGGAVLSLTMQKTKQVSYTAATVTLQGATKLLEKVQR